MLSATLLPDIARGDDLDAPTVGTEVADMDTATTYTSLPARLFNWTHEGATVWHSTRFVKTWVKTWGGARTLSAHRKTTQGVRAKAIPQLYLRRPPLA